MANKYLDYSGLQELVNKMKALVKVTGVKGNAESSYRTGNVNLTAANVGAFEKVDYAVGTTEAGIRPLINQTRANRLIFLPADQIIIEKTTDGGVTWESAGVSDENKGNLFSENGTSVGIPLINNAKSKNCGIRITITGMKYNVPDGTAETEKYNYWNSTYVKSQERYFNVREWWFWISSGLDRIRPEIYCATGAKPNNWLTVFNKDFGMEGWSGSDYIRAGDGKTFGGSTSQTGNYWNWRLIFWTEYAKGKTEFQNQSAPLIQQIRCYGDNVWGGNDFAKKDHLYSWDRNKNAKFPAQVTATGGFSGNLTGTATKATNDSDGNKINTTYLKKSEGVTNVAYDSTNHKLTKTINGTTSDIVDLDSIGIGNASTVNGHTVNADVPANAVFTDTVFSANLTYESVPTSFNAVNKLKWNGEIIGRSHYKNTSWMITLQTRTDLNSATIWSVIYSETGFIRQRLDAGKTSGYPFVAFTDAGDLYVCMNGSASDVDVFITKTR